MCLIVVVVVIINVLNIIIVQLTGTESCRFVWSKTPGQNMDMDAS